MVNFEIICFSIIISLLFIFLGLYFKKKASYISLTGSAIIIITGIVMLGDPLLFPSGTYILINGSIITTEITYAAQNVFITSILASAFMLLGFFTTVLSILQLATIEDEKDNMDIGKP